MRNNLKSPLTVEEIVPIVRSAITNYETLFLTKYPFEKLDFVMCPEFKYGGMENVGCITYSESHFVKRQRENLADEVYFNVIVHHEM
jgi:aminopeptidase N